MLPVFEIWFSCVSKMYDDDEELPSFLPPKIRISELETGHAPNQYLISFSKLCDQTLISSQYGCSLDSVSSLSMSVTDGS